MANEDDILNSLPENSNTKSSTQDVLDSLEPYSPPYSGYLDAARRNAKAGFGSVYGGLGRYAEVHAPEVAKLVQDLNAAGLVYGNNIANSNKITQIESAPPTENDITAVKGVVKTAGDWGTNLANSNIPSDAKQYSGLDRIPFVSDYWTNPAGAAADVGQGVGSSAALLPIAVATAPIIPEEVPAIGAGLLGKGLMKVGLNKLGQKVASEAGQEAVKWGTAGALSKIPEAVSEGGNIVDDLRKQGYTDEQIKGIADQVVGKNIPLLMGEGAIELTGLTGKLGKLFLNPTDSVLKRVGKNIALNTATGMPTEWYTEGGQQAIQNEATGQRSPSGLGFANPFTWGPNEFAAAGAGAVGALPFGIVGGAYGGVTNNGKRKNTSGNRENSENVLDDLPAANQVETAANNSTAYNPAYDSSEATNLNVANSDANFETLVKAISGQESGGNYDAVNKRTGAAGKFQIMPENWASWSQDAGLSPDAPMTPQNQEIVARNKLREYYDKYGPRGAAIAWYGGEGALDYSDEAKNRKQGNGNEPSINEYADSILGRMENLGGTDTGPGANIGDIKINTDDLTPLQLDDVKTWAEEKAETSRDENEINFINDAVDNGRIKDIVEKYPVEIADLLREKTAETPTNGTNVSTDTITPANQEKDTQVNSDQVEKQDPSDLISQARNVAQGGDYTQASTLAAQAGDNILAEAYRLMAERYNNTGNNIAESTTQLKSIAPIGVNSPKPLLGKNDIVRTDDGTEFPVQYKVVPANNLVASHNTDFSPNENYPQEMQPRDRDRASMKQQINSIVNSLRPADLGAGRSINQGAPLVNADNVVENGNGRTMALQTMYGTNAPSANAYKQYLMDNAPSFGINPEDIAQVQNPVLVRQRMADVPLEKIITSTEGGAVMGASEQATVDANRLSANTLSLFSANEAGDLMTAANRGFVQSALGDIATPNEMNALMDSDGKISQQGIQRLKNALFAKAYGDNYLLARLAETLDNNVKKISNALLAVAPRMAQMKEKIERGELFPLDITPNITEAVKQLSALRDEGKSVSVYLQEQGLFGEGLSPEAKALLKLFDDNKQRPRRIIELLNTYVDSVNEAGNPKQNTLFAAKQPTISETLESAKELTEGVRGQNLFEENGLGTGTEGLSNGQATNGGNNEEVGATSAVLKGTGSGNRSTLSEGNQELVNTTKEPWQMSRKEYDLWRVSELNRLNPQLKGVLRGEIISDEDMRNNRGKARDDVGVGTLVGGHYGARISRGENAPSGTFSHEIRHMIDLLLGDHQVSKYVTDLRTRMQGRYQALVNYLKQARRDKKIDGRITDDGETAQIVLDAYYRDRSGLEAVSSELVQFLDQMGAMQYAHLVIPYEEMLKNHMAKDTARTNIQDQDSANTANPVTEEEYDSAQKKIDDYEDELIKKYGQAEVFNAPIDDTSESTSTKLTAEELAKLNKLYDERDSIGKSIDNNNFSTVMNRIPDTGPASRSAVEDAVKEAQKYFNSAQTWGNVVNDSDRKDIIRRTYGVLSHALYLQGKLSEVFVGDPELAIETAKKWPNTVYGINPQPLLDQVKTIANAIFGGGKPSTETNITEQPKQLPTSPVNETATIANAKKSSGVQIIENTEKNGIELKFDGKPSEEIRERLKTNGFRWNRAKKVWYAKKSDKTVKTANEIAGVEQKQPEERTSQPTEKTATSPQPIYDNSEQDKTMLSDIAVNKLTPRQFVDRYNVDELQDLVASKLVSAPGGKMMLTEKGQHYLEELKSGTQKENDMEALQKEEISAAKSQNDFDMDERRQAENVVGAGGFDGSQENREYLQNRLKELSGQKPQTKQMQKKPAQPKAFHFIDDSDEALATAMKELQAELNKLSANPVFNVKLMAAAFKVGAIHLQRGVNEFSAWSNQMVDTVGEKIEPFLPSVWEAINKWPKDVQYNDEVANTLFEYAGILYQDGITSLDAMKNKIEQDLGKQYTGLTEAVHAGVTEWPGFKKGAESHGSAAIDGGQRPSEVDHTQESGNREGMGSRELGRKGTDRVLGSVSTPDVRTPEETENPGKDGSRSDEHVLRSSDEIYEGGTPNTGRESRSSEGLAAKGTGGGSRGGTGSEQHGTRNEGSIRDAERSEATGLVPNNQRQNHFIADPENMIGGSPKLRFGKNKGAIEAFQSITEEGREPTPEELSTMAAYTGWGSFGQELFNGSWDRPRPKALWEKEDAWLREHLGKEAWESAQRSIINAHYTDPPTVQTMWNIMRAMGFTGGRVLEPSVAIGNFFGLMPRDLMEKSELTGIELDQTTGGMTKILYPEANVQIKGYQDSKTADNFYDLVIGNWPFAAEGPVDRRYAKLSPSLHDYFFLKALDQTRPGGIIMGITSAGTMDKIGKSTRLAMAKKGELVAAFRLPTGAFEKYAGTKVVTDLIILRKRQEPLTTSASNEGWINLADVKSPSGQDFQVNEYYVAHPDHVLGELDFGHGTTTGRPGMIVNRPANLLELLNSLADRVPQDGFVPFTPKEEIKYLTNNTKDRQGSIVGHDDGNLYVVSGEHLAPLNEVAKYKVKSEKETLNRENQIKALVGMRKAYGQLIDAERDSTPNTEELRKVLNKQYKSFVKQFGNLTDSYGLNMLNRVNDPAYGSLAALEYEGKPAKILTEPTTRGKVTVANPSIRDAYIIARNESMDIDIVKIAKAAHVSEDEVIHELEGSGAVFRTPAGNYEVSDVYLSGNVRRKLREAQDAFDGGQKGMERNIEALQKVIPKTVPYFQIEAKLGAPWVKPEHYQQFIAEMLGVTKPEEIADIKIRFGGGSWGVRFENKALNSRPEATTQWGVSDYKFDKLLTAAMNNRTVKITYKDEDGKTVIDEEATTQANDKITKIREEFPTWAWKDAERRIWLENNYNEVMNAVASPHFDGSFMEFPGMALKRGDSPFNLRQHQQNAIYRGLVNGRGIYAHEVGTGKSYTIGGIAVESRRYGIAKKPLIFAHNANSASLAADINQMYPGAKVLYIEKPKDFDVAARRIANDDWDAIVVPHSLINKFALTRETLDELSAEEIAQLEQEALDAAAEDNANLDIKDMDDPEAMSKVRSVTAKELVKERNRIIKKIDEMAMRASKEGAIPFEELGIDLVLVDEAHEFKKPPITTKMTMRGLNKGTSDRSVALRLLTDYVKKMNNGRGVHTFTGTPITNTLTEIYHQMRYVMDDQMERDGIKDWDTWFSTFADSVNDVELTATGEYEPITRLAAFVNVPELRRVVGQYMDIVFADQMPEFRPRETPDGKTLSSKDLTEADREALVNGRTENPVGRPYKKIINDIGPMTEAQKGILGELVKLAKKFKNASKKERFEIMKSGDPASPVLVETAAANAGMDPRLVNRHLPDNSDLKENCCIRNVITHYKEHPQATQVIFMERGYNDESVRSKTAKDGTVTKTKIPVFNMVKDMVNKMVEAGIPREQIAVVDGSVSKEKRKEIADAMNESKIRVVIGNTATLGVGVNMQTNLRAMHHLDAPWMPGELEQRNGRGWRQGNKWNTVLEYRYITEKLDGRRWQVLAVKDNFIKKFLKADENTRVVEGDAVSMDDGDEVNDITASLSEATGDPRTQMREKLKTDIAKLEKRERMHTYGIADAAGKVRELQEKIKRNTTLIKELDFDYKQYIASKEKPFSAVIDGKRYDNRKDTDAALEDAIKRTAATNDGVELGKVHGFTILMQKGWLNTNFLLSGNGEYSIEPSMASVEGKLRGLNKRAEALGSGIDEAKASIERLKEVQKQPFAQADTLVKKRKMLDDLEKDLQNNPVPAPSWLRQGAPVGTEIYVDGKPTTVEGHKWGQDNYYVITDKGSIPYTQATDESGVPIYEPHVFEPAIKEEPVENSNGSTNNRAKLNVGFDPTFGEFDNVDLAEEIRKAANRLQDALPGLVELGKRLVVDGYTKSGDWVKKMRELLGEAWSKVKSKMVDVWKQVKDMAANECGNVMFAKEAATENREEGNSEENNTKESVDSSDINKVNQNAVQNLAQRFGIKPSKNVTIRKKPTTNKIGFFSNALNSVNEIAQKHPKIKPFFRLATMAMEKQETLRNEFRHRKEKWEKLLDKNGKATLYQILLQGDIDGKDYTNEDLRQAGYSDNVIKAYRMVRVAMDKAYNLTNEIRQGIEIKSENLDAHQLEALKSNKFVTILKETPAVGGYTLVTYKTPKIREDTAVMTEKDLDEMRQNPNVEVLSATPYGVTEYAMPESSGLTRGDGFYEVHYRSQTPPINKLKGYIPHFFHDWFIMQKEIDEETGKSTYTMLDSGTTMQEATQKANKIAKENPDMEIVIQPKQFRFEGEQMQAAVVGDYQYFKMQKKIAEDLQISLSDAKQFMDGKVGMKGRHRFMGNFLQRKGAAGYEQNLDWVLSHHFNMVSRYVAMDPFKSKSISTFERLFGRWDNASHEGVASYVKDYINDVNGVPTNIEKVLNDALNLNPVFKKYLGAYFGDRPALQLVSGLTNTIAVLKLGMLNVSSALLQVAQFINVGAALNDYGVASKGLARAIRPDLADRIILRKAGIDTNLTMESGSYSRAGNVGKLFKNSTILFHYLDMLMRRTAILGAYHKAISQGKSKEEALQYAKSINTQANFDYSVADAPNLFRRGGPVAQLLLQFKKFGIKEVELIGDLLHEGTLGQNLRLWIPLLLLSGLFAGPPFANTLLELLSGILGVDLEEKMKKAMFTWAGEDKDRQTLIKAINYGILSTDYTGSVDISNRTGLGDIMPTELKDAFGPAVSTLLSVIREVGRGNINETLKAVSPGVGNIAQAVAGESKTARGRTNNVYDTMYERLVKGLGFRLADEAVSSDLRNIISTEEKEKQAQDAKAIDNYINNPSDENRNKLAERRISGKRVSTEIQKKSKTGLERSLQNVSKGQRGEYEYINSYDESKK